MRGHNALIALLLILTMSIAIEAKKLPSVTLKTMKGQPVNSAEVSNDGKPIIISFFALWCKPCLRELTAISEVYQDWQAETGVKLIAVSIDDSRSVEKVQAEVSARGFEWEVWLDTNSDLRRAMNVGVIPHVLVLDGNGDIQWQHSSYSDGGEEAIIEQVKKLLTVSTEKK